MLHSVSGDLPPAQLQVESSKQKFSKTHSRQHSLVGLEAIALVSKGTPQPLLDRTINLKDNIEILQHMNKLSTSDRPKSVRTTPFFDESGLETLSEIETDSENEKSSVDHACAASASKVDRKHEDVDSEDFANIEDS